MIVTLHLCMPSGDAMRRRFGDLMEIMKKDNRGVIAAMLSNGIEIPDTVGDLGLTYDPERHRSDGRGQPVMDLYGVRDMVGRKTFSCGDAAAYEAAVMEEVYGVPTLCIAVAQGDDDLHAIYVTADGVVDPTANWKSGRRPQLPAQYQMLPSSMCSIEEGRVVCIEEDVCAVDADGTWYCPSVPGLSGRNTKISNVNQTSNGQAWARTRNGGVVPVRRR